MKTRCPALFAVLMMSCAGAAPNREGSLTLQNAVAEALANNPSIRAALRKWSAARARVPQAKAWDDPRVSYD
ncbi:MAG: TolC family protein, partial [Terrimicrobiaceae bacterium]|nr:TolC family protein [Terrimicrobiaceae bacterium]